MQQWYQCPYCSSPVSYGCGFCTNCGNKLNWPSQQQAQPPGQNYHCPNCKARIMAADQTCWQCRMPLYHSQQQTRSSQDKTRFRSDTERQTIKPLRKLGLILLAILLFISLFIFGPMFTLKQTTLNPRFITAEVNKLEMASLAVDLIDQQTPSIISHELSDALSSLVTKIEPQVKDELSKIINSIYGFILDKRENPELTSALRNSFLSTNFISKVINELDTASLVKPVLQQQLSNLIPKQMSYLTAALEPGIESVLHDVEPLIKQQLNAAVDPIAEYLIGTRNSFTIAIPTEPIVDKLSQTLLQTILSSSLPELAGFSQQMITSVFNSVFTQFSNAIPEVIEFDQTLIGKNVPAQIAIFVSEAEDGLREVKEYVGYIQTGYIVLIILIIAFIAGIVFLSREVKRSTRVLGITILSSGFLELAALLISRGIASEQLGSAISNMPLQLQIWLKQLLSSFTTPLLYLSIGLIVVGAALVFISVAYKSGQEIY